MVTAQPVRNHCAWNSQFTPTGFLFTTAPRKFALLSVKEPFSSWFSALAQGFAVACVSQIATLCYSQINHFAGKATDSLIFKVNMPQPRCPPSCSPRTFAMLPPLCLCSPFWVWGWLQPVGMARAVQLAAWGRLGNQQSLRFWFGA